MSKEEFYIEDGEADSPEEAQAIAMERFMKLHPNAKFESLKVVACEEIEEN